MQGYIIRRLIYAIPTLIGVTIVIFLAMRIIPGDVAAVMFGSEGVGRLSDEDRRAIEASLGLDRPLYQQYGAWIRDIVTLKFGESYWRGDSIMDLMKRRGPVTIEIAILGMVFSWMVGVPVGILSALFQDTLLDYVARVGTIFWLAVPGFWVGSIIVMVLLIQWGWKAPPITYHLWDDPWKNIQIVLGPAVVLGLAVSGYVARITRSSLLEVIREDYIRTARAKGLAERVVVVRHALRNAMLPVVTLSGVTFGFLIGGSVVIEQAFAVQGLGKTLVTAFNEFDFMVMQNLVLFYGFSFVLINLLVDLTYGWLDPRIRLS
jgi:peptide/nickel transport system permease protein